MGLALGEVAVLERLRDQATKRVGLVDGGEPLGELIDRADHDRDDERVLRREVAVERAWRVVGEVGDAFDREGFQPLLERERGGGVQDAGEVGAVAAATRRGVCAKHEQIMNHVYESANGVYETASV